MMQRSVLALLVLLARQVSSATSGRMEAAVPVDPNDHFEATAAYAYSSGNVNGSSAQQDDDSMNGADTAHGSDTNNDGGGQWTDRLSAQELEEWRRWFEEWKAEPICEREGCDTLDCFMHPSCPQLCDSDDDDGVSENFDVLYEEDDTEACMELSPADECSVCSAFACRWHRCQSSGCCNLLHDKYDAECLRTRHQMFCEPQQPKCWGNSPTECATCGLLECIDLVPQRYQVCGNCEQCDQDEAFEFVSDLDTFVQLPTERDIEHILSFIEYTDLDAPLIEAHDVLSEEQRQLAIAWVEEGFANTTYVTESTRKQYKHFLSGHDLIQMFGPDEVMKLLRLIAEFTGDMDRPITTAFIQRFEHDGDIVSPYHTDDEAISLVILLNDDYEGGEMTYLRSDGPYVAGREAGYATVHGAGMVHGNAALRGIKYQLTLVTFLLIGEDQEIYANHVFTCIFDNTELA